MRHLEPEEIYFFSQIPQFCFLNRCRPGFFHLALENEFGCTPCFCYGHSVLCKPAKGYSKTAIESAFVRGNERWTAGVSTGTPIPLVYDALTQTISVSAPDRDNVYFLAPGQFSHFSTQFYNNRSISVLFFFTFLYIFILLSLFSSFFLKEIEL